MTQKKSAPSFSQEELDNRRRQFARKLFLKQLDIKCPWVRTDLLKIWVRLKPKIRAAVTALQDQLDEQFDAIREEVLAKYSAPDGEAISVSGPSANVWSWYRGASLDRGSLRVEFETDIREWARKYRIEADWVINTAIENIASWFDLRAQEQPKEWIPPSVRIEAVTREEKEELEFSYSYQFHWWKSPESRTQTDMKKEAWKDFDKAFGVWFRDLIEKRKQRGYEKKPRRDHTKRDIGWLVRFQYKGEECADIAQGQEVTASAVSKAVEKAADFLGIEPREARRGPPPKK